MRKQEQKRAVLSKELAHNAAPLLSELRGLGFEAGSLWDLVNAPNNYLAAIPVLSKHLSYSYHPRNIEGIVRALTTPEARGIAGERLLVLFKSECIEDDLRWVVGNALAEVATEQELPGIVDLLEEQAYGASRSMLVFAVARLLGAEAISLLMSRLYEEGMTFSTIRVLGNLRAHEARQAIVTFIESVESEIRQEARKALRKIDRPVVTKG